jgi:xanthine dehydrogenase accessory factor
MTPATLAALLQARAEGRSVVLATRLADGRQALFPGGDLQEALRGPAEAALLREANGVVEASGEQWFLHVHAPAPRLVLVGAVHIAQALVPMANALGIGVTVVDPRPGFNTEARFPGVARVLDWPDVALAALRPDRRMAVVALAHDPKLDDPALDRALRSEAFYVGALGSRKSQAARLERLSALGHAPATLARVRGPVGLALGAVSAPEIALSILAEMVAVRRGSALAARG